MQIKFQNGALKKKMLFLTSFSHIKSPGEKTHTQKNSSPDISLTYLYFGVYIAHPIAHFYFPNFAKIVSYPAWFLFDVSAGVDLYS